MASHIFDERADVARPTYANRGGTDQILEDQIPTDDPRDELAHGGVRVRVGAACDGNHGRHLRVAKPGKGRRDGCDGERKGDGRPCVDRGSSPGEHEDTGADNAGGKQKERRVAGAE